VVIWRPLLGTMWSGRMGLVLWFVCCQYWMNMLCVCDWSVRAGVGLCKGVGKLGCVAQGLPESVLCVSFSGAAAVLQRERKGIPALLSPSWFASCLLISLVCKVHLRRAAYVFFPSLSSSYMTFVLSLSVRKQSRSGKQSSLLHTRKNVKLSSTAYDTAS